MNQIIDVIIPAFNEAEAVGLVVRDIPKELVRNIVVVDNNSSDLTREVAEKAGAIVVAQPEQGYGAACLKGMELLFNQEILPDIIVFLDADYSDYPMEMYQLVDPILKGEAELVIGSRSMGNRERGSMMPQQIFGNWLATKMMKAIYGAHFSDLGPFRAISRKALEKIDMKDRDYGWTVEMQVKALKNRIPYTEVPVKYRKRKGVSKITGTIKGTVMAGYKIIFTILRYA